MCSLYAFLRIADDLADNPGPDQEKRQAIGNWRKSLQQALAGEYTHPIYPALHHAVEQFAIPPRYLFDALDGVEMDLQPTIYNTFAELRNYCYHVASVVGLCCIHIWGFSHPSATGYAEKAGIAFQLTNILRDLAEDAIRGRVYLPREDFVRFRLSPEGLAQRKGDPAFRDMMKFQVLRARKFYESSMPLLGLLNPCGQAVFLTLAQTYRSLLDAIEKQDYDVFEGRVRLKTWHKVFLALRSLPIRWGWISPGIPASL